MSNVAKVHVVGRLTRDNEMKETDKGTTICENGIAVNGYNDHTSFFDFTIFGKRADSFAEYTNKGDLVYISGRLKQERWKNADDETRTKVAIIATDFSFLPNKHKEDAGEKKDEDTGAVPF